MLKKYKYFFTNTGPKTLFNSFFNFKNTATSFLEYKSFGKLNKNKKFYIIRRHPSAGLFSNITFILNHLKICEDMNLIPIVDMENYPTIYNEKNLVKNERNSWEYYFKKFNNYSLSEIYNSKNVFLSNMKFEKYMALDMTNPVIKNQFKKIKIKDEIIKKDEKFYKKNLGFKNNKILGIHLRGSTYKTARGHAFPPTPGIMIEHIESLIKEYKYNKIFIVTEEQDYLNKLLNHFGKKCIYYNSYRMKTVDSFNIYPRKKHRYLLGQEILIEALILSKCEGLCYIKSNVISAAILIAKKKLKLHEIYLGLNSRNKIIAPILWYLKKMLPKEFGGLKIIKKNGQ